MAKRFSIINFILVSILVALGIFLSVCSFKIPFYTNDYASFAGAITLSYDVGDGQTAVYNVSPVSEEISSVTEKDMKNTVDFVRNVLYSFGASFNQVGIQDSNSVRAIIPQSDTSKDLMNALANREEIIIRGEDTSDKTDYDISANRIKNVSATYQQTSATSSYTFGVIIELDDLGKKQYKELTKYVADNGNTVYFYNADGKQLGSMPEITREVSTGVTFLPQSSITTEHQANMYAINVMMGAIDVELSVVENSVTSAYLGYNSINYVAISLAIAFVVITLFMIVRYRDLGLISMLTGLINVCLYLFLLQALPIVTLSITGIIGCVLGYTLSMYCHVIVFQKIREEYKNGKKIPLAFKLGFKESLFKIIDLSSVAMLISVALYLVGFDVIKSFAIALFIGALLAIFSTLCVTRLFTKWYLPLNSTKANKLALKKEASNED